MAYLRDFVCSQLQAHAQHVEWKQMGDSDVFVFSSDGKNTSMSCCVRVKERTRNLCITAGNGIKAPVRRIPQAYELVCRLNTGMAIGYFWLDPNDGEVSFTITANLLGMRANDRWFGSLVFTALATFDKYLPLVSTVLYGKKTPKAALAAIQEPSEDEVTNCLERLFSASNQESAGGDDAEQDSPAEGGKKGRRIPEVDVKITPADIEETLGEERQRRRRRTRKSGDDDTQ
jgi:hypothetical protein